MNLLPVLMALIQGTLADRRTWLPKITGQLRCPWDPAAHVGRCHPNDRVQSCEKRFSEAPPILPTCRNRLRQPLGCVAEWHRVIQALVE